jgi:hypothetical protein
MPLSVSSFHHRHFPPAPKPFASFGGIENGEWKIMAARIARIIFSLFIRAICANPRGLQNANFLIGQH